MMYRLWLRYRKQRILRDALIYVGRNPFAYNGAGAGGSGYISWIQAQNILKRMLVMR